MKISKKEFHKYVKNINYDELEFDYAVALEDMPKGLDYSDDRAYLFELARVGSRVSGGRFHLFACNCFDDISKGEVFIVAKRKNLGIRSHYTMAIKTTKINTIKGIVRNYIMRNGNDARVSQYLNKQYFKRSRNVFDWYAKEKVRIYEEISLINRDLVESFSYISLPEPEPKSNFTFHASKKRVKSRDEVCYRDFKLSGRLEDFRLYKDYAELEHRFINSAMYEGSVYPLYEVKYEGVIYLFEASEFSSVPQETIDIEYVNTWENLLIEKERDLKKIRKYLDRCLNEIESEVYAEYPLYRRIW